MGEPKKYLPCDRRIVRWLERVGFYLAKNKVGYDCASGLHESLWDNVVEAYSERSAGPLQDIVDGERESYEEGAKKGGDYYDDFVEWCNYCADCERGRNPDNESKVDQYRQEFAQERIDQAMQWYHPKDSSGKRSRSGTPELMDHIDDVDDDIQVALAVNYAEPDADEKKAISRIAKQENYDRTDLYERYYRAVALLRKLDLVKAGDNEDGVPQGMATCPDCWAASPAVADPCYAAAYHREMECPCCNTKLSLRTFQLTTQYLFARNRFDFEIAISTNVSDIVPRFPGEDPIYVPRILRRMPPIRFHTLQMKVEDKWSSRLAYTEALDKAGVMLFGIRYNSSTDGEMINLAYFTTGEIVLGGVFEALNEEFVREPTEQDYHFASNYVEALIGCAPVAELDEVLNAKA